MKKGKVCIKFDFCHTCIKRREDWNVVASAWSAVDVTMCNSCCLLMLCVCVRVQKREQRALGAWRRLVKGMLIKDRVRARFEDINS